MIRFLIAGGVNIFLIANIFLIHAAFSQSHDTQNYASYTNVTYSEERVGSGSIQPSTVKTNADQLLGNLRGSFTTNVIPLSATQDDLDSQRVNATPVPSGLSGNAHVLSKDPKNMQYGNPHL